MLASQPNRTSLTTSKGRMIDLLNPTASDVDFDVIAEHLAKANRYCGATPNLVYSVAEHSCRCADAALKATGDRTLAAYLLCHDMHEAYLGDDTTPKKRALEAIMTEFGILAPRVQEAFGNLTYGLDVAIHEAAGLAWPYPSQEIRHAVHHWDRVLLATEWRDLMRCDAPYDFGVEPLLLPIFPAASWITPMRNMQKACDELLPVCRKPHDSARPNDFNEAAVMTEDKNAQKEIPGKLEMFEGRLREVVDPRRQGWWRFHKNYDRDGYCDNPGRGY